jgi:uncharacterized membrane protein
MAEERRFPWRGAFIGLAALVVLAGTAVIGAYAGGVRLVRAGDADPAVAGSGQGSGLWQALSPEQRAKLRRALGQAWRGARAERAAARQARMRVVTLAAQANYDTAAMQDALSAMRAADALVAAKIHDGLALAMADLTPSERAALLAASARFRGRGAPPPQTRNDRPDL